MATMLKWTVERANARESVNGKTGAKSLVITGRITGPDGSVNKTPRLNLNAVQLKGSTIDFSGYNPGNTNSVIVVTRPESTAKRGRKASTGQTATSLAAFLKSVQ